MREERELYIQYLFLHTEIITRFKSNLLGTVKKIIVARECVYNGVELNLLHLRALPLDSPWQLCWTEKDIRKRYCND